jgi:hypothetical protein
MHHLFCKLVQLLSGKKLTLTFVNREVIHAYAKSGGTGAATKAQELLTAMDRMHRNGNSLAKPDTITVSFSPCLASNT